MLVRAGLALGLIVFASAAEAARLISAKGAQSDGYGRIVLTFDTPVKVKARLSGSILVIGFGESVSAGPEKIAAGMPDYISVVRRDPDGSGLRLALQRPYRINVQDAGERVFVDLLPENWTGFPPPLPTEVIADLAKRAAAAEAILKARNPAPAPRPLALELSHGSARTRLSLRIPPGVPATITPAGERTRLTLPGAWKIDDRSVRGRLDPAVGRIIVETDEGESRIIAAPAEGMTVGTDRDDEFVTIDFLPKPKPVKEPEPKPVASAPAASIPAGTGVAPAPVSSKPASNPSPSPEPPRRMAATEPRRAGSGLVFPFAPRVPAAPGGGS